MYRILIIEEDFSLAQVIKKQIEPWGNEVRLITDFQNVIPAFAEYKPHLVLLNIILPFFNGYHWCSEIRKISNVPIVFISSASDNMNIVMAMNMGGDDFISKPVDPNVINAKIQAILRRSYSMTGTTPIMEHCGAILNLSDNTLDYEGSKINLTKNEFRILHTLMEQKGNFDNTSEQVQHTVQIDLFPDMEMILRSGHIIKKKFQNQGTAQSPPFYLEIGKSHGLIDFHNILYADESRTFHRL